MTPGERAFIKRLQRIERRLVEGDQRLARVIMHGKVKERRQKSGDWQVRLDMGEGEEGPVLSPWIPVQPVAAGGLKVKVKPTIGERMMMLSPSGTVGSGSFAMRAPFDQDHPAPAGEADVVLEVGQTRLTIEDGKLVMTNGRSRIELDGETVKINGKTAITGATLTHNGKSVSETHTHKNVMPGAGVTGPVV